MDPAGSGTIRSNAKDQPAVTRSMPQDLGAEAAVLGSMIVDPRCIGDVIELIKRDAFYHTEHQLIFDAILALFEKNRGEGIDGLLVRSELERCGQMEAIGGPEYLQRIIETVPSSANVQYYTDIIREKMLLRETIAAATDILRDAYDETSEVGDKLDEAERKIFAITDKRTTNAAVSLKDLVTKTFELIEKREGTHVTGLGTGYYELDDMTCGLQKGEMIIIAARPSMGKTALVLNLAEHMGIIEKYPLAIFSLEMGKQQLAERFLCSHSGVDAQLVRKGMLSTEHYQKLVETCGIISEAPIFIDDTSALTPLELRAKARRLRSAHGIRCIMVDYLQLMHIDSKRIESRQQEITTISRYLKSLARELDVPVVVLSQLNRSPEGREDHRPRMSDLRESGCLAGDTLVTLADTGQRVPIRDLRGRRGFRVWSLNLDTLKLEPAEATNAFSTGRKPVFRLTTRLGRSIRATANHRFFTLDGWRRLDELQAGMQIALPRQLGGVECSDEVLSPDHAALLGHLIGDGCTLPRHAIQYTTREQDLAETVLTLAQSCFGSAVAPRIARERQWYQVYLASAERLTHGKQNPVARWLRELGIFGLRSYEKRVPEIMFAQETTTIACFLRHLWATDGCIRAPRGKTRHPAIYYASSSELLARDVQSLLLRLGINAILTESPQGTKGRTQYHVLVTGREDILAFAERIGAVGAYKTESLQASVAWVSTRQANTNRDVIPQMVWRQKVVPAMKRRGMSMRAMQAGIGTSFCGSTLYKTGVSRQRLLRVADVVSDPYLRVLAQSDVYWDRVVSIEPDGEDEVFDLTVREHANFVANDVVVHNSIEQDADVVMLLHREDYYHRGEENFEPDNTAEIIIAKQRNGPTGTVKLMFREKCTRFENLSQIEQEAVPF